MGIVNDALPYGATGDPRQQPNRESRFALGYGPLLNVSAELLDRHLAGGLGHRPALCFEGRALTYRLLSERVNRLANALTHLRVTPGSRVLIHLPNRPEFTESWLASLRIGGVVVATMPMLKQRELSQIVTETAPECLITTPELADALHACAPSSAARVLVGGAGAGAFAYEELIARAKPTCPPAATTEDDVALIAYTSGSAGRQKGTVHTHSDVLAIADTYAAGILSPSHEDVFACHATMGFTFGLGALLVFPLRFGASAVLDSAVFDPTRLLDLIMREGVTRVFATPTAARLYLEQPICRDRRYWRSVRTVVSAGEALSHETFARWIDSTGTEILDGCGSTEMLHIWISQRHGEAVGGCTGTPVPHYRVRLLDDDGQVILGQEAEGVAVLQGPTGCRYWWKPELQAACVKDGWTLSGDIFRRDANGRYAFVSRTDDIIVSGGYKVAPREVQEVLLQVPEVREAVVVGTPDATYGQVVRACLVPFPGVTPNNALAQRIREHVRAVIATFKCPRDIIFLQDIPRTATGKPDRHVLATAGASETHPYTHATLPTLKTGSQ